MRRTQNAHPYEHSSGRRYKREISGLSKGTVLLAKTPDLRVSVIDSAPFPKAMFRCRIADMKLCVQQIDEVITAVGILLAESS